MSPPPNDHADRNEGTPASEPSGADGPTVVFEFVVPSEAIGLEAALREFPDLVVEAERFVPTTDPPLPYLWTNEQPPPRFTTAAETDPRVSRASRIATFDDAALYRFEWDRSDGELLSWCANNQDKTTLLKASGHGDEWRLKIRFLSHEDLSDFQDVLSDCDHGYRVVRLYELEAPKLGQYNLTAKQRDAVLRALEMGYFSVPRETTLEEVADALGISPKSASERLRRGQTNLVSNTLNIGRTTGIGLPDS
ncbi:helix-turn-helix domain-containing protein [Halopiger goleimassiliensis]|uniref:helix-turn-helix domain-containing protein n=1 Tax=Halopiger goleimassiliensis TaxID=1293048 RepID=UPI000677AFEB|nr:helix-turn-helix domain-containing protein [Halopiger goleimassiliensis]